MPVTVPQLSPSLIAAAAQQPQINVGGLAENALKMREYQDKQADRAVASEERKLRMQKLKMEMDRNVKQDQVNEAMRQEMSGVDFNSDGWEKEVFSIAAKYAETPEDVAKLQQIKQRAERDPEALILLRDQLSRERDDRRFQQQMDLIDRRDSRRAENSPPATREFKEGGEIVTKEWRDGKWIEIGRAPRSGRSSTGEVSLEDGAERVRDLISFVSENSDVVGARGKLGYIKSGIAGQTVGRADPRFRKFQVKLEAARSDLRSLVDSGRFSDQDRKILERLVGGDELLADAESTIEGYREILSIIERNKSVSGAPPKSSGGSVSDMTDDELLNSLGVK